MSAWREDILAQAVDFQLLTEQQAEEIRQRELGDEEFIRAVLGRFSDSSFISENSHRTRSQSTPHPSCDEPQRTEDNDLSRVVPEEYGLPDFIDQKYELSHLIGRGGMGTVWKAIDRKLERTVAVKFPRSTSVTTIDIEQMRREGKTLAKLSDPHLVPIHDAGSLTTGQPYLVMPFIEAEDIAAYATRTGRSRKIILRLMATVARAIARAHTTGIIHRDLKPSHVLIKDDGTPVVIDFGLAKAVPLIPDESSSANGDALNAEGINSRPFGGTAGYRAPEQLQDGAITASCDVYALGVILFELLTGRRYHRADKPSDQSTSSVRPSDELASNENIPYEVRAILVKCLRRDSNERYSYAGDLATDLEDHLAGNPVSAVTKMRALYEAKKYLLKHKYVITPILLLLLSLLTFWTYHTWQLGIETKRALEAQGRAERGERRAARETIRADSARNHAEAIALKQSLDAANAHLRLGMYEEARQAIFDAPKARWGWECDRVLLEGHFAPRPARIVGVHDWAASALLISSDGQTILSAGQDGRIALWNRDGSIQGTDLFAGQWNALLGMWQHATLASPGLFLPGSIESWSGLEWLDDGEVALASSLSGKIFELSVTSGKVNSLLHHPHPVTTLSVSTDQQSIAYGDDRGHWVLVSREGQPLHKTRLGSHVVLDIGVLPDASWIIGTEAEITVRSKDGSQELTRIERTTPAWSIDTADDGTVAISGRDGTVALYRWEPVPSKLTSTGNLPIPHDERGRPTTVYAIQWARSGRLLAAGDDVGRLMVWEMPSRQLLFAAADQEERRIRGGSLEQLPMIWKRRTAAIAFALDEDRLWTVGHDSTVKEWNLRKDRGIRRLDGPASPKMAFDASGHLWIADQQGKLSLVDSDFGKVIGVADAHEAPIVSLCASDEYVVTTAGTGAKIWRNDDTAMIPMGSALHGIQGIQEIAISSTGDRLAALCDDGNVILWDRQQEAEIGKRQLSDIRTRSSDRQLAFNADGSRIAVLAESSSLYLLDGRDLSLLDRPSVFGSTTGSAFAWHPSDPGILAAGNRVGRIQLLPETFALKNATRHVRDQAIVDLCFHPKGNRLIVASASGRVVVFEPYDWGPIHTFASTHAEQSPIRRVLFDPTGKRLLLVHQDGHIEAWDSYPSRPFPRDARAKWEEHEVLDAANARNILFQEPSLALNRSGRPTMLYVRATEPPNGEVAGRIVGLVREVGGRFREETITNLGRIDRRQRDAVYRSLAVHIDDEHHWIAYRQPRPDIFASAGQLLLLHRRQEGEIPAAVDKMPEWTTEPVGTPGNNGFHSFILPDQAEDWPDVVHFSENGKYLLVSERKGPTWKTTRLGRQGDGFDFKAIQDPDGTLHVLFDPTRYNGDPLPGLHLLVRRPWTYGGGKRRFVQGSPNTQTLSMAIDHRGRPLAVQRINEAGGIEETAIHRFEDGQWQHLAAIPTSFARDKIHNLVVSKSGVIFVAILDNQAAQLRLGMIENGKLHEEVVADLREAVDQGSADDSWSGPYILIDDTGRLTMVLSRRSWHNGWLRCYRRMADK